MFKWNYLVQIFNAERGLGGLMKSKKEVGIRGIGRLK